HCRDPVSSQKTHEWLGFSRATTIPRAATLRGGCSGGLHPLRQGLFGPVGGRTEGPWRAQVQAPQKLDAAAHLLLGSLGRPRGRGVHSPGNARMAAYSVAKARL